MGARRGTRGLHRWADEFVPEEVNVTDELPIGYEDLKAFYQTNAERVFKL